MNNPEIMIIALNIFVISAAYFVVYPKFCGADGMKIANNDIAATGIVLIIAGSIFWGTGEQFSLILFSVNWFWFTFLTYLAIELPLMIWYFKKHDVWPSFKT
ncbi:MAG: hypothetical protein WD071_00240 [Pseudohongiella sp.]|uniref:hypothetical protein n=1 Tax=Pseudohongiella sp. TaxID=1979412 RepID=UPI0034A0A73D